MTETVVVAIPPDIGDLTNAELAASFGSDMFFKCIWIAITSDQWFASE